MSVLRFDATTDDWIVFAPERGRRPGHAQATRQSKESAPDEHCPFCPGNEHLCPGEIYAVRRGTAPNQPGWSVRVVPNRFPALRIEEQNHRIETSHLHRQMGGCGAHEVVIESPEHDAILARQPAGQIELVLRSLQARFNDLLRDVRFQTIVIFKNHGLGAGTSLRHPHWQIIALPVVPRSLRHRHDVAVRYLDQTGRCIYADLLEEELAAGERVLAANDHFAAILPYASHMPFETWILPRRQRASFGLVPVAEFRPLTELLKLALRALHDVLDNPDFNLTFHSVPRGDEDQEYFSWHLQVLPRLTTPAGFELGSGMSINTVMPEDAAAALRDSIARA
jgi:UDPglucose--hexose-1-phosphate uridylyltransferase